MKHLEQKVFMIIGKYSKTYLAEKLGITKPTLDKRINRGGWLNTEIEVIEKLRE